jgi:hypothetical protein
LKPPHQKHWLLEVDPQKGENIQVEHLKNRKGKEICCYYNKVGHLKNDCWKLEESKEDSKIKENLVESGLGMIDEVLSISNVSEYYEEWLLYFGHFTPYFPT